MKGAAITFMLIMIVVVLLIGILVGWTVMNSIGFFEMNEINAIKQEFSDCNDKILETARTGISNKCMFPVERGEIIGTNEGINYELTTRIKVCDKTPMGLINPEKNLWQSCDISGRQYIYSLKWNSTNIKFSFERSGNLIVSGRSGSVIEMTRSSVEENETNLLLRVY